MIKSKNNTFGLWVLGIFTFLSFLLFLSFLSTLILGINIINIAIRNDKELYFLVLFSMALLSLFISILWHNVKYIVINEKNKTISFKNIFIGTTTEYNFSDLDGFIETTIPHDKAGSQYKTIGLVQGNKIIKRIDSYYYSNYEELYGGLSQIKNMGSIKFGFFKRIKMMLNLPVLE